jgi:hypothetical protein
MSEQSITPPEHAQPAETHDGNRKYAVISLVVGLLDLPALFCAWMLAFAFGAGGNLVCFGLSIALPFVLCIAGIISGIAGLRSKRRLMAIAGIVLSSLILLLMCGLLFVPMIISPSVTPILTQ